MSDNGKTVHSRKTVIRNSLIVLGGAIGLGGGAAGARALAGETANGRAMSRVQLDGHRWLLETPDRKPGERIVPGDRGSVTGLLVDPHTGKDRGRFFGTRMAFASGGGTQADGSMELHTFSLDDGTILGMGSVVDGANVFSIVGGTGRYAGASGPTARSKGSVSSVATALHPSSSTFRHKETRMAFDAFLKLDGFPGESKDQRHPDEIEIESFSWGLSNSVVVSGGGGGAGKASFQDINFTNRTHKSSPKLMLACASGQHIKKAVLSIRKAGASTFDYIKLTFEDVLVSSFQEAGDTGGDAVADNMSLNFATIDFEYTEQNADGSPGAVTEAGWDLRANKST